MPFYGPRPRPRPANKSTQEAQWNRQTKGRDMCTMDYVFREKSCDTHCVAKQNGRHNPKHTTSDTPWEKQEKSPVCHSLLMASLRCFSSSSSSGSARFP